MKRQEELRRAEAQAKIDAENARLEAERIAKIRKRGGAASLAKNKENQ